MLGVVAYVSCLGDSSMTGALAMDANLGICHYSRILKLRLMPSTKVSCVHLSGPDSRGGTLLQAALDFRRGAC